MFTNIEVFEKSAYCEGCRADGRTGFTIRFTETPDNVAPYVVHCSACGAECMLFQEYKDTLWDFLDDIRAGKMPSTPAIVFTPASKYKTSFWLKREVVWCRAAIHMKQ